MSATTLEQFVEDNFGEEILKKLESRHRGGINNAKGNSHETHFAVYKIAKFYAESQNDAGHINIQAQAQAFVDDLVISNRQAETKYSYQLKDSVSVSWTGQKGIQADFELQYRVDNDHYGIANPETVLVLANRDVYEKLVSTVPKCIQSHTRCIYFENPASPNVLIFENQEFRTAITQLSTSSEPDILFAVAQNLIGAWGLLSESEVTVKEIVDKARKGANPNFFKSDDDVDLDIDNELKMALDNIKGLSFDVKNGYLSYSFSRNGNEFSGTVKPRVGTEQFRAISNEIITNKPSTIFALAQIAMSTGEQA